MLRAYGAYAPVTEHTLGTIFRLVMVRQMEQADRDHPLQLISLWFDVKHVQVLDGAYNNIMLFVHKDKR